MCFYFKSEIHQCWLVLQVSTQSLLSHGMLWAATPTGLLLQIPSLSHSYGSTLSPQFHITHVQFLASHSCSVSWITFSSPMPRSPHNIICSQFHHIFIFRQPCETWFQSYTLHSLTWFVSYSLAIGVAFLPESTITSIIIANNGKGADEGHIHKDQSHISTHRG